ncbi:hypothetical protein MYCTH_2130777 [Thermothelomyces thermophilus ATCC 42464]|uniref:Uncharacterized protein n=1 Tax=Thermothelomyces thermophilus (strain ATCC 42464 / BCRC 31852 / DSM 1799) TaxID=573729 RepID=G2QPU2_THET4|nr:uncharacterized protein MYCTH_2130777 [Thermothelomyces thermophilus ATCC 42464]AEO61605.1 hypothetical protein MYCTH_2130777 [Thermothelomyces thermophilus ATCC 42464]
MGGVWHLDGILVDRKRTLREGACTQLRPLFSGMVFTQVKNARKGVLDAQPPPPPSPLPAEMMFARHTEVVHATPAMVAKALQAGSCGGPALWEGIQASDLEWAFPLAALALGMVDGQFFIDELPLNVQLSRCRRKTGASRPHKRPSSVSFRCQSAAGVRTAGEQPIAWCSSKLLSLAIVQYHNVSQRRSVDGRPCSQQAKLSKPLCALSTTISHILNRVDQGDLAPRIAQFFTNPSEIMPAGSLVGLPLPVASGVGSCLG